MRARRLLALALAIGLGVSGCGVPAQDEPHRVDLPRQPLTGSTSGATTDTSGDVAEVLCFVRDGRLLQTVRRVERVPGMQDQLGQLGKGPTEAESNSGMTTAVAGLTLTVESSSPGGVTVQVAEPGEGSARSNEILAYGQIVCTLTGRADVSDVSFTRQGEPLEVPRADGTLTSEPLRSIDYGSLLGPA